MSDVPQSNAIAGDGGGRLQRTEIDQHFHPKLKIGGNLFFKLN